MVKKSKRQKIKQEAIEQSLKRSAQEAQGIVDALREAGAISTSSSSSALMRGLMSDVVDTKSCSSDDDLKPLPGLPHKPQNLPSPPQGNKSHDDDDPPGSWYRARWLVARNILTFHYLPEQRPFQLYFYFFICFMQALFYWRCFYLVAAKAFLLFILFQHCWRRVCLRYGRTAATIAACSIDVMCFLLDHPQTMWVTCVDWWIPNPYTCTVLWEPYISPLGNLGPRYILTRWTIGSLETCYASWLASFGVLLLVMAVEQWLTFHLTTLNTVTWTRGADVDDNPENDKRGLLHVAADLNRPNAIVSQYRRLEERWVYGVYEAHESEHVVAQQAVAELCCAELPAVTLDDLASSWDVQRKRLQGLSGLNLNVGRFTLREDSISYYYSYCLMRMEELGIATWHFCPGTYFGKACSALGPAVHLMKGSTTTEARLVEMAISSRQ